VNWFKRYLVGCLIALFALAAIEAHDRPGNVRYGSVIVMAAVWPMTLSIVMGAVVGEMVREGA
jgi:hypothetical protein